MKRIPEYVRIQDEILRQITSGERPPDTCLPSEEKLAEQYNVSRMTARHALTRLVNAGYLYRIHGKGTFINKPRIEKNQELFKGFKSDMEERGFTVSTKTLLQQKVAADPDLKELMHLSGNQELVHLKRIRYIHNTPIVLQESFLPEKKVSGFLDVDFEKNSLYSYLETEHGIRITRARQKLQAMPCSPEISPNLDVEPGFSILYIRRISFSSAGQIIEVSHSYFRGDKFAFETEIG